MAAYDKTLERVATAIKNGNCGRALQEMKVYLTASVKARAERRCLELKSKGQEADLREIEEDIRKRDSQDMTRKISPLRQAEDAVLLDSSDLNLEEVVERIVSLAKERMQ